MVCGARINCKFLIVLLGVFVMPSMGNFKTCTAMDTLMLLQGTMCPAFTNAVYANPSPIYIMYDVNPSEGFNLRRDVYIRLAVFIRNLRKKDFFSNVKLVLPPFRRLYHWKSTHINQDNLPWKKFFNLNSLRMFAPVIDYEEFLEEAESFTFASHNIELNFVYQLKHFEEMFENGVFRDKFEFAKCNQSKSYPGFFLTQKNLKAVDFMCLKFQGSANMLESVIRNAIKKSNSWPKILLFLNAEVVLHDHWGSREFWQARRSMRFNRELVDIANEFRERKFNSTDSNDLVQRPFSWRHEKPYREAQGGNYLCAHLRRADFLYGREKTTPTLKSASNQIKSKLKELNLTKVFISSDCTQFEFKNIKAYLTRVNVFRFSTNSMEQKDSIKDGGIAIIDQLVCSNARYFIGTYESTFTYRIYEEREILGFPKSTTFNTLCKNDDLTNCSKNSVWPIEY